MTGFSQLIIIMMAVLPFLLSLKRNYVWWNWKIDGLLKCAPNGSYDVILKSFLTISECIGEVISICNEFIGFYNIWPHSMVNSWNNFWCSFNLIYKRSPFTMFLRKVHFSYIFWKFEIQETAKRWHILPATGFFSARKQNVWI